ncbi:MAG: isoprenylcysteine carboxylmethyltransferase family protein [Planctomycetes bacterium]|nr:isoprenylcysteine carboxylmethyltransferase family protein [Planctomycetota bacterium]
MVVFAYGVASYVVFVLTALYAVGFVDNWVVSQTIDGGFRTGGSWLEAGLVNAVLLGLFALQHAFMGRPVFRSAWARILPAAAERSTHVLVSSLSLMLVFLRWRPIPLELWSLELHPLGLVFELLSFAGWALAFVGTIQIGHLELFGLAQVLAHVSGKAPAPAGFDVPFLYRWVRHPIYLGLLAAVWCAPAMTLGHLLFAGMSTAFVVALARMEERDLAREHREYRDYQARVPMLLPRTRPLPIRRRAG